MVENGISADLKASASRARLDATAGALAGAVSRLVVGPLDVVKIRMQVQLEPVAVGALSKYTGVWQALRQILAEEGIKVRARRCYFEGPQEQSISGFLPQMTLPSDKLKQHSRKLQICLASSSFR
jgi:hypothetical protein